jgi:hypothetical protein
MFLKLIEGMIYCTCDRQSCVPCSLSEKERDQITGLHTALLVKKTKILDKVTGHEMRGLAKNISLQYGLDIRWERLDEIVED